MGMTMTQKILAMHVGREFVEAGDLLVSQVDLSQWHGYHLLQEVFPELPV